jgi:acetyl-CoA carboxylase biotin carboxyl carrier protein
MVHHEHVKEQDGQRPEVGLRAGQRITAYDFRRHETGGAKHAAPPRAVDRYVVVVTNQHIAGQRVEKDIAEFELERGDVKLRIRRGSAPVAAPEVRYMAVPPAPSPAPVAMPAAAPSPHAPAVASAAASGTAAPAAAAESEEAGLHVIRSPIVGTFYEAPSPGAPPFVKQGDTVSVGQVLCIIEAMKLMNEIESDYAGEVAKRYVANGQPVEYGQPLFAVRPK